VKGSALAHITDFGTLRGRIGYIVGNFLPYATVGLAAGRADINNQTNVYFACSAVGQTCTQGDVISQTLVPLPLQGQSSEVLSKWLYGYAVGAGLEVAVLPNVFVRGEWEFIQFGPFSNTTANLNALRIGAGVRF
ncbi:MAG: outer membrane beta-barrel protein, partial [Xanthobacteraceae bacterium]